MSAEVYAELIAVCAGMLLLSSIVMVWRQSVRASITVLAVQGWALAALVAVVGINNRDQQLIVAVAVVLALKGIGLPVLLARGSRRAGPGNTAPEELLEDAPRLNPTATLVIAAALASAAYAVFSPLVVTLHSVSAHAAPVGIAMVLIGFLLLATRRRARGQLIGFLVLDNGIATVAFLISGGVPLLIEFGASLDLVLVVLILQVFTRRMGPKFGSTNVDQLRELHD